jgi:hypothetical protein
MEKLLFGLLKGFKKGGNPIMKNKNILIFSLISLTALSLGGCKETEDEYVEKNEIFGTNANYDVLGMGNLPIGMWVTPSDAYRNDDAFAQIAECGINTVLGFAYFENTDEKVNAVLDYCQKYHLKYIYASLKIESDIKAYASSPDQSYINDAMSLIAKFANHPAFAGTLFIDEPSGAYFDAIAAFFSSFKKLYPGKLAYVNNLALYGLGGSGYSRYEDYVDNWIKKSGSEIYSYDCYPLYADDGTSEGYEYEDGKFYYNLDILRAKTLQAGLPLWSFASTLGFTNPPEKERRTPSREDMRWSVFSDLVFGSKAIQYFTYFTPGGDSFGEGLVNRAGEKTERFGYAKEINAEINSYGPILMNCDAVGVLMEDYRRNPQTLYEQPKTGFGPIRSIEGNNFVLGCFQDKQNGQKYAMLLATNPRNDIAITLNLYSNVKSLTSIGQSGEKTLPSEDGKLKVELVKGDTLLLKL